VQSVAAELQGVHSVAIELQGVQQSNRVCSRTIGCAECCNRATRCAAELQGVQSAAVELQGVQQSYRLYVVLQQSDRVCRLRALYADIVSF